MKRIVLVGACLLLSSGAFGLAACGSGGDEGGATSTAAGEGSSFNDADVLFLQSMIPHHEQAIEMAELALDPQSGAGKDVIGLATRIQAAQDGEIAQMKQRLTGWGKPIEMDTSDGHDMSEMEGMMSAEEMAALDAATGESFDTVWLSMMTEHHKGAISMARAVGSDGTDAEVAKLAGAIATAQQKEIDEMTALLAG